MLLFSESGSSDFYSSISGSDVSGSETNSEGLHKHTHTHGERERGRGGGEEGHECMSV